MSDVSFPSSLNIKIKLQQLKTIHLLNPDSDLNISQFILLSGSFTRFKRRDERIFLMEF